MYEKLQAFRSNLQNSDATSKNLYFAKVDATSCFDTLPQDLLLKLASEVLSTKEYNIARYAELKPFVLRSRRQNLTINKPLKTYRAVASDAKSFRPFRNVIKAQNKMQKPNTVFHDAVVKQPMKKKSILELVRQHVKENVVKIGKKFFRQKQGISQGSVLSSILCNICYAAFEKENLAFINDEGSLLVRLIDDFLLITTTRARAIRFLEIMHAGNDAYGLAVKREKSLTNFDVETHGRAVPHVDSRGLFPYCGMLISCDTLDIIKDGQHLQGHGKSL